MNLINDVMSKMMESLVLGGFNHESEIVLNLTITLISCFVMVQSSRVRKNEANYHEPTGSDDGVDISESDDDVSRRSESSNPPQTASREIDQLEINRDNHLAGESPSNDGDVNHRTTEELSHVAIDSGKNLYLFSGGGFCVPDEDEISGLHVQDSMQAELQGDLVEGHSKGADASQCSIVEPVTSSPSLRTEDTGVISQTTETQSTSGVGIADLLAAEGDDVKSAQVDASVGMGLRAMPFLRRKRPSKQP